MKMIYWSHENLQQGKHWFQHPIDVFFSHGLQAFHLMTWSLTIVAHVMVIRPSLRASDTGEINSPDNGKIKMLHT
ncbi:hypothetical protein PGT21_030456 [Puccinia graminis f. sp. tritici]|uniref:Uncharacterized protein n=1 Tax=Puccinia graminis f. sp. tritici TaxID=56615 RepID=A0A5B0N5P3_PUCGR|nr:hypothetical protein PGT21_030456 [Puccinia graminis f. sp. tritici]